MSSGAIAQSERKWIWLFAVAVMLVTSIPYLIGYFNQGEQWEFTGFVFGVEDGNSYIAKMLTGARGAWLFRTPYTAQPQNGVIAFLPYILAGKLSAAPGLHEQLVALYHLYRILSGFLAIHATYGFIAIFVHEIYLRKLGTALTILGGGLGWLLILLGEDNWLGSLPLDFYSPESFGFLSLYGIAHLNLARAGLLWGLTAYLKSLSGTENGGILASMKIGGWWLVTAIAQPLTAIVFGLVIGLHLVSLGVYEFGLARKSENKQAKWMQVTFKRVILAGFIPLPFIFYNLYAFRTDPFLIAWTEQNIIKSPHPWHYVLAFGVIVPFAYYGARQLLRHLPLSGLLPITWASAVPLLAYIPFNLQRRMPEGAWTAIVVLAMCAFQWKPLIGKLSIKRWLPIFGVLFISSFLLIAGGVLAALNPSSPVYRQKNEVMAFKYLAENAQVNDVVLAVYSSSNALPSWAPVRVVVGHGPESVGGSELKPVVEAFFQASTTDVTRKFFLEELDVRFVLWGPEERELGEWQPGEADFLKKIYDDGDYQLFEVKARDD